MSLIVDLEKIKIIHGHSDYVETIAVSHMSGTVMTCGRDGKVLLWDSCLNESVFSWIPYNGRELYHADMSDDTNIILACNSQSKEAILFNRITHESFSVPLLEYCHSPRLNCKDMSIVSHFGKTIYKIHLFNHKGVERICNVGSPIRSCHYFRSKEHLIVVTKNGLVQIIDLSRKMLIATLPKYYSKIAFITSSYDNSFIAVGDKRENIVDLWKIDLCSQRVLLEKIVTFCIPNNLHKALLSNVQVAFIDESCAFVCPIPMPLFFVDFRRGEIQIFDDIGYCDNFLVNPKQNLIYLPYGKINGSVIVFSYKKSLSDDTES